MNTKAVIKSVSYKSRYEPGIPRYYKFQRFDMVIHNIEKNIEERALLQVKYNYGKITIKSGEVYEFRMKGRHVKRYAKVANSYDEYRSGRGRRGRTKRSGISIGALLYGIFGLVIIFLILKVVTDLF